jgi:hypothetical protein
MLVVPLPEPDPVPPPVDTVPAKTLQSPAKARIDATELPLGYELLTYEQFGQRRGTSPDAARSFAKRHGFRRTPPESDGKIRVIVRLPSSDRPVDHQVDRAVGHPAAKSSEAASLPADKMIVDTAEEPSAPKKQRKKADREKPQQRRAHRILNWAFPDGIPEEMLWVDIWDAIEKKIENNEAEYAKKFASRYPTPALISFRRALGLAD